MKRWTFLLAMLVAGCGRIEPHETVPSTDEPRRDVDGYDARIAELQRELDAAMPAGEDPDELGQPRGDLPINPSSKCLVGADLRDRVCDLADRICTIAASEPDASDVHGKCTRARDACANAKQRVASACGEL